MPSNILCGLLAIGFLCPAARADLLDDFRAGYPPAAERIQQAYSHVRMKVRELSSREPGKITGIYEDEFMSNGSLVRGVCRVEGPSDNGYPVGSTHAFGGSAREYFGLFKHGDQSEYALTWLRQAEHFDLVTRGSCPPMFGTYCIYDQRITDYLNASKVTVLSAKLDAFDGREAVHVRTVWDVSPKPAIDYQFFFEPHTWLLLGWTRNLNPKDPKSFQIRCVLDYEPHSSPPKLARYQMIGELPSKPGESLGGQDWRVESLQFGEFPLSEFTVAAFGMEAPVVTAPERRNWPLILGNAIGFAALGIVFAILAARRRHRKNQNPPPAPPC